VPNFEGTRKLARNSLKSVPFHSDPVSGQGIHNLPAWIGIQLDGSGITGNAGNGLYQTEIRKYTSVEVNDMDGGRDPHTDDR
jgi:hypothetical protein